MTFNLIFLVIISKKIECKGFWPQKYGGIIILLQKNKNKSKIKNKTKPKKEEKNEKGARVRQQ